MVIHVICVILKFLLFEKKTMEKKRKEKKKWEKELSLMRPLMSLPVDGLNGD